MKNKITLKNIIKFCCLLFLITILLVIVIFFWKRYPISENKTSLTKSNSQNFTYPQKNIILFTRCYGGKRQPKYCNLYSSDLKDPEEKHIYTFDLPDVEQTDYELGFKLIVNGIIDKNVFYSLFYWNKTNDVVNNITKYGFVDIVSGNNTEYYSNNSNDTHLVGLFINQQNKQVFFSVISNDYSTYQVIQYSPDSNDRHVLMDSKDDNLPHVVIGSSPEKIFLSVYDDGGMGGYYPIWDKTLDLETGTIIKLPESIIMPIFDQKGSKVAYEKKEEIKANLYKEDLIVKNTDGNNEKIIRSIQTKNTVIDDGEKSFANYFFNSYGNILSYSIETESDPLKSTFEKSENYLSIVHYQNEREPEQKGIHLLPPENSEIYKTIYPIIPGDFKYEWIKFRLFEGPLEGNIDEGVIYEKDDGWYFKPIYGYFNESELDFTSERKIIAANADNLHLIIN